MDYAYTARTGAGEVVRGRVTAETREGAVAGLRRRALFVTSVEADRVWKRELTLPRFGGGTHRARIAFFRSLATLVRAGVPLRRGLGVALERANGRTFTSALRDVLGDIERGDALSTAFGRRPDVFSPLVVAMVAAGEAGGVLDEVLERIARVLERDDAVRKSVGAALAYPATVLTASFALIVFLIVRVMPAFAALFESFHVDLPPTTRAFIAIGDALTQPAVAAVTLAAVVAAGTLTALAAGTRAGRRSADRVRLGLPIAGSLLRKTITARLARMLGTLVASGVELSAALEVVVPVTGSPVYAGALAGVALALREGEALTPPLAACALFDPMFLALTGIGEETGMLDVLLPKAADYFEADVEAAIATLGAVVEPALIGFLGAIVGLIVYSVYVPLYSLIASVSK
jgi:type IV pilus assembly protein PilC